MSLDQFSEDPVEQKKQWIDAISSKNQFATRAQALEAENVRLREANTNILKEKGEQKADYEQRIIQYNKEIVGKDKEKDGLIKQNQQQQQENEEQQNGFTALNEETANSLQLQIKNLKERNSDLVTTNESLADWEADQDKHTRIVIDLKKRCDELKHEKNLECNAKELEKIQATEGLRKEMLMKIKETKANLMALNNEQLGTTTRLTILQNHQLTTELEYQSKQCEQLLVRNNKMKAKIDILNRDIGIHQDVEKELAKRSHFSQKVIKKLKDKIRVLESQINANKSNLNYPDEQDELDYLENYKTPQKINYKSNSLFSQPKRNASSVLHSHRQSPLKGGSSMLGSHNTNDDLIQFLEHKLEQSESTIKKQSMDLQDIQNSNNVLSDRLNMSGERYKRAALIMTEFLDDLLSQSPNILNSETQDMHLNLEKLKEKPFEELDKQDKVALTLVLLKQLQPYISASNLSTDAASGHMAAMTPNNYGTLNYQTQTPDVMLKQGALIHSADRPMNRYGQGNNQKQSQSQSEVDTINNILRNINVQTDQVSKSHRKFNSIQVERSHQQVKFPPI